MVKSICLLMVVIVGIIFRILAERAFHKDISYLWFCVYYGIYVTTTLAFVPACTLFIGLNPNTNIIIGIVLEFITLAIIAFEMIIIEALRPINYNEKTEQNGSTSILFGFLLLMGIIIQVASMHYYL